MKSNFYLAAAALTLSLAACTNEDDLQVQGSSNQISPIKFTLETGEGLGARNYWGDEKERTLVWDESTLLSLLNGGDEGCIGYANAIYKAAEGGAEDKLSFTTQSMVNPGQAIMVHPADTTFEFMNGILVAKVPEILKKKTTAEDDSILQRVPFVSEGINIAAYNAEKNQGAGYGKEYNIKLRQVATVLDLKFNYNGADAIKELLENEEISQGITIDTVELTRPEGFNTKVAINLNTQSEKVGSEAWSEVAGNSIDEWNAASEFGTDQPVAQAGTLKSAYYDANTDIVRFMLLPQKYEEAAANNTPVEGRVAEEAEEEIDYSGALSEGAQIVLDTYYGTLTLKDKEGVAQFPGKGTKGEEGYRPDFNISQGLNYIVWTTNQPNERGTFVDEVTGKAYGLYVEADLADLDMSTVHIKNNQHLSDVIAVHEALQPEKPVTFIIDGDENDVFEMSTENVKKLAENPEIKLQACRDIQNEECYTIRLTGATEVPAIDFLVTKSVKVILANEATPWTWTGGERKCLTVANLINEGILNVADGAELALTTGGIWQKMINNGTMNIDGEVKQSENIENNGIINIGEGDEYYVNAVFTNEATELGKFGKIYNSGVFGNVNDGVINNYGYIQQVTKNSKTFITSNQTDGVSFGTPWSADNKYGTIELFDKDDDNYSVSNTKNEGFILLTTTDATVTAEEIGVEANYVKVAGECTALNFTRTATENTRVLFIEIASKKEVEWTTEGSIIRGLKVDEGKKLYIKKDNKVEISEGTYLKGKIYKGGDFTPKSFVTYFGTAEDEKDSENVIKWK